MRRRQRRRARRRLIMISDKVRPHHLERKAILYVRQSSAHQVLHNRESSALQYAMRDRLTALGWAEVDVIDDDLGRSAAGGVLAPSYRQRIFMLVSADLQNAPADPLTDRLLPQRTGGISDGLRCDRCAVRVG